MPKARDIKRKRRRTKLQKNTSGLGREVLGTGYKDSIVTEPPTRSQVEAEEYSNLSSVCPVFAAWWGGGGVKGSSALGGRNLVLMSAMPRLFLPDFGLSLPLSPVNKMR